MSKNEFPNFGGYEAFIKAAIAPWSPAKRIVLAASMAERWLPAYEIFSANENWGDPAILRQSLDSVWKMVDDHAFTRVDWAALMGKVHSITPHMDDFDANE